MSIPMESFSTASYFAGVTDTLILGGGLVLLGIIIWFHFRIKTLEDEKR